MILLDTEMTFMLHQYQCLPSPKAAMMMGKFLKKMGGDDDEESG